MNDRDFLIWIHQRLEHVHDEPVEVDYMHRLRAIIATTPPELHTPNRLCFNSIEHLLQEIEAEKV